MGFELLLTILSLGRRPAPLKCFRLSRMKPLLQDTHQLERRTIWFPGQDQNFSCTKGLWLWLGEVFLFSHWGILGMTLRACWLPYLFFKEFFLSLFISEGSEAWGEIRWQVQGHAGNHLQSWDDSVPSSTSYCLYMYSQSLGLSWISDTLKSITCVSA